MFGREKLETWSPSADEFGEPILIGGHDLYKIKDADNVMNSMEAIIKQLKSQINEYRNYEKKKIKEEETEYLSFGYGTLINMTDSELREHIYYNNIVFKHLIANHSREVCSLNIRIKELEEKLAKYEG